MARLRATDTDTALTVAERGDLLAALAAVPPTAAADVAALVEAATPGAQVEYPPLAALFAVHEGVRRAQWDRKWEARRVAGFPAEEYEAGPAVVSLHGCSWCPWGTDAAIADITAFANGKDIPGRAGWPMRGEVYISDGRSPESRASPADAASEKIESDGGA